MSEVAVKLTNMRAIPMLLPDGQGNTVELAPGETKIVWGDYAYFRRMPAQGVSGLVVKLEAGKVRLLEDKRKKDVGLFSITNNRQIPMLLATGVERRKHVEIGPGATVEVVARESIVKQMGGLTVKTLQPATPPPQKRVPAVPPAKRAAPKVKAGPPVKTTPPTLAQDLASPPPPVPPPPVRALAEALAQETLTESPPALTSQDEVRKTHSLPDTREDFEITVKDFTWHDLRGLARELGVRGRGRVGLTKSIGDELYGG